MDVDAFIAKYWGKPGGAERAVYQMFLTELAQVLGAATPDAPTGGELGNYQFEGPVKSEAVFLSKHNKRIDLYKRDCFILEAKQSQLREGEALPAEPPEEALEPVTDLFGNVTGYQTAQGKRPPRYDRLMADARIQAQRYSLALPTGHKPPPFLIVADIGRAFELYFDWTGDGRGYGFFPDQQNYRILLTALAGKHEVGSTKKSALDLLRAIWIDPASVDPRKQAVAVTRDIAERLSRVAEQLEKDEGKRLKAKDSADFEVALGIENTSLFLMRVLFCMFAEDVELLPKGSFTKFLDEARSKTDLWWRSGLHDLWAKMNQADEPNRFWSYGDAIVRYFNGNLFSSAAVYDLPQEFKGELFEAARRDWRAVEPAIFGTLLEQVLTRTDRAKLGAHYTPRPYVQRLVNATIGDVLVPEWQAVREHVAALLEPPSPSGEGPGVGHVSGSTRPKDSPHPNPSPQGEGLELIRAFHARLCALRILDPACGTGNFLYVAMELLLQLEGEALQLAAELGEPLAPAVHPNQFLGLELNSRAAVITELVLWIGWLRHRLANHPEAIGEPVLPTLSNINFGTHGGYDAVLLRTATGEPDFENPMPADWPEADFIVGNPPFIGKGKDMREALGDAYVDALPKAYPTVPLSSDFVMYWWENAANQLRTGTRRFGFISTNSIKQVLNRATVQKHLQLEPPLTLAFAVHDHPWRGGVRDAAVVRISMTVGDLDARHGKLLTVIDEANLQTDSPQISFREEIGRINADLTVGADASTTTPLLANQGISWNGLMLSGRGFLLTDTDYKLLEQRGESGVTRKFISGKDITARNRHRRIIDPDNRSEKELRQSFPFAYEHLLLSVKPERDKKRDKAFRENWWLYGRNRTDFRQAVSNLSRYIVVPETSSYRLFQFLPSDVLPEHRLVCIATGDAFILGVLLSRLHVEWSLRAGGTLEDRPTYTKSQIFDTFPFPDATAGQRTAIAELADELDATRTAALAENPGLTMTELYNLRERLRSGERLTPHQQDRARQARAGIVDRLHQQIDAAVAEAYGWPADLPPAEIVARLVVLNAERAAEEKTGHIRWLRPDYQIPRFGKRGGKGSTEEE